MSYGVPRPQSSESKCKTLLSSGREFIVSFSSSFFPLQVFSLHAVYTSFKLPHPQLCLSGQQISSFSFQGPNFVLTKTMGSKVD